MVRRTVFMGGLLPSRRDPGKAGGHEPPDYSASPTPVENHETLQTFYFVEDTAQTFQSSGIPSDHRAQTPA